MGEMLPFMGKMLSFVGEILLLMDATLPITEALTHKEVQRPASVPPALAAFSAPGITHSPDHQKSVEATAAQGHCDTASLHRNQRTVLSELVEMMYHHPTTFAKCSTGSEAGQIRACDAVSGTGLLHVWYMYWRARVGYCAVRGLVAAYGVLGDVRY
eukprot:3941092-Rhodomonas_salina.2